MCTIFLVSMNLSNEYSVDSSWASKQGVWERLYLILPWFPHTSGPVENSTSLFFFTLSHSCASASGVYELSRVSDAAKHWAPPFFCHLPTQVTIKDTCFLLAWPFYKASVPGIGHQSLWGAGPPCPWSTIPVLGCTVCPVHSEGAKRCLSDLSCSPRHRAPFLKPCSTSSVFRSEDQEFL